MKPFLTTDLGNEKRPPVDSDGMCVTLVIAPNYYEELRTIVEKLDAVKIPDETAADDLVF